MGNFVGTQIAGKSLMSRNRAWLYAGILFVLVGTILTTQVSWILQAARIEESFLNQRVSMALCSAMDVLSKDKAVCSSLESCAARGKGVFELVLNKQDKQKIDSVILQHLLYYNINVPFKTKFSPYSSENAKSTLPVGQALLYPTIAGMQNILVNLEIPSHAQLIQGQINGTFILSIVVLCLLTVIVFSTLRSLTRERKIRKETVDFINTMAHDLKTPISNISFAASLLTRDRENSTGSNFQYLAIIEAETGKLKQRARKILGVASVDAVLNDESSESQIDVHQLIIDSTASFSLKIAEGKGKICERLEATRSLVAGGELQLTSALMNVIDNAFVYSEGASIIQISTRNTADSIRIEIEDNGPGIPLQEQELIFKKGYRIKSSKNFTDGFGLGLYLAKTMVEKQGGKLCLYSDGRSGSRFTIELPLS
jgi:signal transduction histidine kinase